MGLKGKIEAIIYAAEEPVSLEQIALLVKDPALQELAEERTRAEATEAAVNEQQQSGSADSVEGTAGDVALGESIGTEQDSSPVELQSEAHTPEEPQSDWTDNTPQSVATSGQSEEATVHQPQTAEVNVVPEAVLPGPELTATHEANSESPEAEASPVGETAEQPLPEASEKTKANVASKRRAKAEIPPEVRAKVRAILEELIADYSGPERGMEIRQIAGGYRMTTKPEHHDVVKAFAKSLKPPLRLSMPALETLAVIAYKQPVTAPEVGEIRGVDSQGVLATLLDRKLITTAGRKAVIGRPILYKTTKEFLMRFGLNEISELPSMEEFEKLALEAGQVDMFQADEEDGTTPAIGDDESAASEGEENALGDAETNGDLGQQAPDEQPDPATHVSGDEPQVGESSSTPESDPAQSEEPVH